MVELYSYAVEVDLNDLAGSFEIDADRGLINHRHIIARQKRSPGFHIYAPFALIANIPRVPLATDKYFSELVTAEADILAFLSVWI